MKIQELLESPPPEFRDEVKDQSQWITTVDNGKAGAYVSLRTITNTFNQIGTVDIQNIKSKILIHKKELLAGVYLPAVTKPGDEAVYAVASIVYFKKPLLSKLPDGVNGTLLQIDRVATVPQYEKYGLAANMYAALIQQGYIVVSDSIQYLGGKLLWQKIAREAQDRYSVYVFDREVNDYLRDESGQPIKYNSRNINDDVIWKPGKPGQRLVLLAYN